MTRPRIAVPAKGFTLIELMTTIAIAAILMAIAAPGFIAFQRSSELSAATNGLVAAIAAARGEATKRGRRAMVVPTDGTNWQNGWVVFIDQDASQKFDGKADLTVLTQPALPSYFTVTANSTAAKALPYLMFDASGYPISKTGAFGAITMEISRNDLGGPSPLGQTRRVMINPSGRVRSCQPASANDDTCSAPTTTDASS
jgi:type IV fimbrial biogenesis protein FimT